METPKGGDVRNVEGVLREAADVSGATPRERQCGHRGEAEQVLWSSHVTTTYCPGCRAAGFIACLAIALVPFFFFLPISHF